MPGLEKRLARYAQFYSRIGFVHEFRSLSSGEVRQLLAQGWKPAGVTFPAISTLDAEAAAAIIRVTGGNFRLLDRLLTQMERITRINDLAQVTKWQRPGESGCRSLLFPSLPCSSRAPHHSKRFDTKEIAF